MNKTRLLLFNKNGEFTDTGIDLSSLDGTLTIKGVYIGVRDGDEMACVLKGTYCREFYYSPGMRRYSKLTSAKILYETFTGIDNRKMFYERRKNDKWDRLVIDHSEQTWMKIIFNKLPFAKNRRKEKK